MAASAGVVSVDFTANAAAFNAEIRRVNAQIDGLGKGFNDFSKLAKTAFAAISAGFVVNELQQVITKSLEMGEAISDAAKKAGIAAGAFSELAFAAKLANVDINDLSSAFKFFQVDLAKGGKAIQSLGVDLGLLKTLAPEKQFELIAEAVSQIENPAIKAAAAVEVFGRQGANLLPLFENGARGIREAIEQGKRAGATLSDQQVKDLAEAKDAVDELSLAYQGFAATLTGPVAKGITLVIKGIQDTFQPTQFQTLNAELDKTLERVRTLQERKPFIQDKTELSVLNLDIQQSEAKLNAINDKLKAIGAEADARAAAAAAPIAGVNPKDRTFANPAAEAAKKALEENAKLNEQLAQGFVNNNEELTNITNEFLEKNSQKFFETEGKKTAAAIREAARRTQVEQEAAEFAEALAEERAQNEIALKLEATDSILGSLSVLTQGEKKHAAFRKAVAIAETIRNTAVGVARALDYPFPLNIAAAAATAAVGLKQISIARSTPEVGDSGGGGGSFGSGPTIGTPPTSPFNQAPEQQPQALQQPTVTQVIFSGTVMAAEDAIVEIIRKATDNDVIVINQRTAQAQMFAPAQ